MPKPSGKSVQMNVVVWWLVGTTRLYCNQTPHPWVDAHARERVSLTKSTASNRRFPPWFISRVAVPVGCSTVCLSKQKWLGMNFHYKTNLNARSLAGAGGEEYNELSCRASLSWQQPDKKWTAKDNHSSAAATHVSAYLNKTRNKNLLSFLLRYGSVRYHLIGDNHRRRINSVKLIYCDSPIHPTNYWGMSFPFYWIAGGKQKNQILLLLLLL